MYGGVTGKIRENLPMSIFVSRISLQITRFKGNKKSASGSGGAFFYTNED
jgi:hypothetical protein